MSASNTSQVYCMLFFFSDTGSLKPIPGMLGATTWKAVKWSPDKDISYASRKTEAV